jgi:hypothetical protein
MHGSGSVPKCHGATTLLLLLFPIVICCVIYVCVWFKDSLLVIEKYKSGFLPPADHPFEDLSTTDGSTSNISQTGLGVRNHAVSTLCIFLKRRSHEMHIILKKIYQIAFSSHFFVLMVFKIVCCLVVEKTVTKGFVCFC